MKWNAFDIAKALNIYENYPNLWNCQLSSYSDRTAKETSFAQFLADLEQHELLFDMTEKEVKTKIKNIKDVYRKEALKVQKSIENGTSYEDIYKPRLMWYKDAEFLKDAFTSKPTNNMSYIEPIKEISLDIKMEDRQIACQEEDPLIIKRKSKKFKKPNNSNCEKIPPTINNTVQEFREISGSVQREDSLDLFGKYISSSLREMPQVRQNSLKSKIFNLISKEQLLFHNPRPSTSQSSDEDL